MSASKIISPFSVYVAACRLYYTCSYVTCSVHVYNNMQTTCTCSVYVATCSSYHKFPAVCMYLHAVSLFPHSHPAKSTAKRVESASHCMFAHLQHVHVYLYICTHMTHKHLIDRCIITFLELLTSLHVHVCMCTYVTVHLLQCLIYNLCKCHCSSYIHVHVNYTFSPTACT